MRKRSVFTRAAALIMAVALGAAASGCSAKGQPENTAGTQSGTAMAGSSDETPKDTVDNSGKGRYVETTVYEGSGFSSEVQAQTLSDGQIIFLNGVTKQKVVSKDEGSSWEAEENDAFQAFLDAHYPFGAAIAEDGTIAFVSMDRREGSPEGKDAVYDFNLYIYETDNTVRQIPLEMPDADSQPSRVAFDGQKALYVYASSCKNIYKVDIDAGTSEKLVTLADSCPNSSSILFRFQHIQNHRLIGGAGSSQREQVQLTPGITRCQEASTRIYATETNSTWQH